MNSQITSLGLRAILSTSALALTMGITTAAHAQVTTSEVQGYVTDSSSFPVSGAMVTLNNNATGLTRTATTDASGGFSVRNLPVNGTYNVTIAADGYTGKRVENIGLSLGGTTALNFALDGGSANDEIIVVGQRQVLADVAVGPSAVFGLDTLQNAPAINRDIKDIVRLDPRIYVDESFNDAIQCAGASPRFNSLTVDGIRLNDNFGLNSNGYPTERIPFSYDAIEQVSVELAPFDVEYGGFTACNINTVTKSGSNEIHGGAFFDYTSSSLKGEKAGDLEISNDGFKEIRYGFNVGGPIIKDKLFLFGAYEKLEGGNLFGSNTPAGTGIEQSDYDEIISIAEGQYGYTSGGLPSTVDNGDEKILIKADWNINEMHRASATFNYNDGFNISGSDTGSNRLSDGNHFYERGAKLKSYSASLYSDWTDKFSTELRGSYIDLDNRQIPVAGTEFGEIQVRNIGPRRTTVYLGADDSRHANKLAYELFTLKAKADYKTENHLFTFGAEYEDFDVFNLFIQEAEGEWVFNSIDDFRNGDFSDFRYENAAGSNNINDGAAQFGFSLLTFYAQDEWQATEDLTLTAGLRLDRYDSQDTPTFNQNFFNEYGIPNNDNLSGKSLIQPRFGFNWDVKDTMSVRGGFGLYTGGNPNVWISNNYSNNGVTLFESRTRGGNINDFTYGGGSGQPFFDVPDEAIDAVANASGRGPVNALDPDFKLPSEWKFALGTTFLMDAGPLGEDFEVQLDALYSKTKQAAVIQNLELTQTATAPGGRPVYSGFPFNDFLLTNAEDKGDALALSATLRKEYDNGFDFSLGYSYTDAEDVNPMTSSVAFSNDKNYATSDPLNPGLATSNYVIPHRFTLIANYDLEIVEDYKTTFSLFGSTNKGRPYSFVYSRNGEFEGGFNNSRQLLYVPTGPNDPNVNFDGIDTNAFFNFINENGLDKYAGQIAPRNAFNDEWWTKFDLKIRQELPGFKEGHRASGFVVIENLGNFIDSDWGVLRQNAFPNTAELVGVSYDAAANQYTYSGFNPDANIGSVSAGASTWEMRFGVNYDF